MLVSSFLLSMVAWKEAQKVLHSRMLPWKVGTSMVGRSDLLFPQQILSDEDEVDEVTEWESDLSLAEATSAPREFRVFLQASNSCLRGWSFGRLALFHSSLREE